MLKLVKEINRILKTLGYSNKDLNKVKAANIVSDIISEKTLADRKEKN